MGITVFKCADKLESNSGCKFNRQEICLFPTTKYKKWVSLQNIKKSEVHICDNTSWRIEKEAKCL